MNWIEDRAREAEQLENNKRQGNNFARAKKRESHRHEKHQEEKLTKRLTTVPNIK